MRITVNVTALREACEKDDLNVHVSYNAPNREVGSEIKCVALFGHGREIATFLLRTLPRIYAQKGYIPDNWEKVVRYGDVWVWPTITATETWDNE